VWVCVCICVCMCVCVCVFVIGTCIMLHVCAYESRHNSYAMELIHMRQCDMTHLYV